MLRCVWGATLFLLAPATGHAQPEPVRARFSWQIAADPSDCPTTEALVESVRARLGRDPFVEPAHRVIEGLAFRTDDRWTVWLLHYERSGEIIGRRVIEAPSCASLLEPVGLAVTLAIDPDALIAPHPPTVDAVTPPNPEPQRVEQGLTRPALRRDRPRPKGTRPSAHIALGPSLAWALVPGMAPGLVLQAGTNIGRFLSWRAGMLFVPEQRTTKNQSFFGIGLTAASLGFCASPLPLHTRIRASGCLDVAAGTIHAVVYEPIPTDPGQRFWGSIAGSVELGIQLTENLSVDLTAGALLPWRRHLFRVEGHSPAFSEPRAVPTVGARVGLHF